MKITTYEMNLLQFERLASVAQALIHKPQQVRDSLNNATDYLYRRLVSGEDIDSLHGEQRFGSLIEVEEPYRDSQAAAFCISHSSEFGRGTLKVYIWKTRPKFRIYECL